MRLLIITTMAMYPWGGSEELWYHTALAATQAGHEVGVAAFKWPQRQPQLQQLLDQGVTVFERRHGYPGRITTFRNRLINPLRGIAAFKPDLIYINQSGTYDLIGKSEGFRLRQLLDQLRVPYALVCQSINPLEIPSDSARPILRQAFASAKWVGFVAQAMIETAERHLAARIPNARVVRNPANLADLTAPPYPAASTARLATVARLEARKGLDLLLNVLGSDLWRTRDWELSVHGDGPDRRYSEELVAALQLQDRVHFRGHAGDVRGIWQENQLMILPSHYEGMPLAIVEAMLMARPVVATDVGGAREWVQEGITGFLAEAPSVYSIAGALERAWAARNQWEAVGQRARELALRQIEPNPGLALLQQLQE